MKRNKKLLVVLAAALLLLLPAAIATVVYTTTQVQFNVGSVVAFTLTLPGQAGVTGVGGGAATTGIEFNSTTGTNSNANPQVAGGGTAQSDGTPIFSYDNTGTVDLNLSMSLDTDIPSCMNLTGATTFAGADNGAPINSTGNATIATDMTPAAAAQDWYLKADFSSCTTGDTSTKSLTSWGVNG
ncbi:MAG: hypothetical protein KAT77_04150 [Nanoarchaeota archaeon]|nr:hypothetical protein [Nanoarchaeota archaeon]